MNPIFEAHKDKLNAQLVLNEAKTEFRNWKKLYGINPKDSVYVELKEAELAAAQNYNSVREHYFKILESTPAKPNGYGSIEGIPIRLGNESISPLQQEVTAATESISHSLLPNGCHFGDLNKLEPPCILRNVKREPFVRIPTELVLILSFLIAQAGILFQLLMRFNDTLPYLLICLLIGATALTSSSPSLLTLFGWSTLATTMVGIVVTFTNTQWVDQFTVLTLAIIQPLGLIAFFYCLQKCYDDLVGRDAEGL